jgi:endonuclease G, mitochondrial
MIYIRHFLFLATILLPLSLIIILVKNSEQNEKKDITAITKNSTVYSPLNNQQSLLGNPDKAKKDPKNHRKYLSQKPQFDLSYNDEQHIANWVSWHLDSDDVGGYTRKNRECKHDKDLPKNFMPIDGNDYREGKEGKDGYQKGHMCPHGDRNKTPENSKATFVMSNIMPQNAKLNNGPWLRLEDYIRREQIEKGNECYIISGGRFNSRKHKMIGAKQIHVPDWYWKIVVILPRQEGNDLIRITPATRVIAVEMPNRETASEKTWREYRVAPKRIEKKTRLKFFTALSPAVASALRTKVDTL